MHSYVYSLYSLYPNVEIAVGWNSVHVINETCIIENVVTLIVGVRVQTIGVFVLFQVGKYAVAWDEAHDK